jgi:2-dehydro-3-deoxy-D-gluconate 5-dehydrogenase
MNFPSFTLTDRKAVVTGAGRGIGHGIALALANAGADVAVTELSSEYSQAVETANEIQNLGRKAIPIVMDVMDLSSIKSMVDQLLFSFGQVDILVNNAGINIPKLALEVSEQDWDNVLDIDLKGVFFCSQAIGQHMVEQKYGKIVNIASQVGLVGYKYRSAYCAAKAGVVNLTRVLAIEWAQYNINVNAIAPTFIKTPLTEPMFANKEFYDDVIRRIPMGRIGEVEDVLGAVIFLASEASNLVTGHTLSVDGGWVAW